MTPNFDIKNFAHDWVDAWNLRNIEKVLKHFHEDIVFASPTALAIVGTPIVRGKSSLRDYWITALARHSSLKFVLDHTVWDAERNELAIIYASILNGAAKRVSENLIFNENGQVVSAEVFHGIPVSI